MKKRRLRLEALETRENPAFFGVAWQSRDVTTSLVPDGAMAEGVKSDLFAKLAADGISAAQLDAQLDKAVQQWAMAGNINFANVTDDGSEIGAAGVGQGNARFGDIRVFGRPLPGNVLAITTPPSQLVETLAGDIIINTNMHFSIGAKAGAYDLHTVLMQETGHAIGVGNSKLTDSAMFETYNGVRTALAASDVVSATDLYGARTDAFEGKGNGSRAAAAVLPATAGTSTLYAKADVSTTADADYFKFTTPAAMPNGVTVIVRTARLSMLTARVEIQDSTGKVLASATGVSGADTTLTLPSPKANTTYYAVVRSGGGDFAIGGYRLSVVFDAAAADPALAVATVSYVDDQKTNETMATATTLSPTGMPSTLASYTANGTIAYGDFDYYKFTVPAQSRANAGSSVTMFLTFRASGFGVTPYSDVYDAAGNLIPGQDVSGDGTGARGFQYTGLKTGDVYYIRMSTGGVLFGVAPKYTLNVEFRSKSVEYTTVAAGTLTPADGIQYGTLYITRPQVISYNIATKALGSASPLLTTVKVFDRNGTQLSSWAVGANASTGHAVMLMPGEYAFQINGNMGSNSTAVSYTIKMITLTDPIGISPTDPNYVAPPPTGGTADSTSTNLTGGTAKSTSTTLTAPTTTTTTTTTATTTATTTTTTTATTTMDPDFSYVIYPPDYYLWLTPML